MSYEGLNNLLASKCTVKRQEIFNITWQVHDLDIFMIGEYLNRRGTVLYEDIDRQCYAVTIKGGIGKMNPGHLAFQLRGNELDIAAYAKEALINQNTIAGILDEFEEHFWKCIER